MEVCVLCPRAFHFNTRLAETFPFCLDDYCGGSSLIICTHTHTKTGAPSFNNYFVLLVLLDL